MADRISPVQPHETPNSASLSNTNRFSTRQLVVCALLCAIAILLSFVEFPLLPAAAFLKYDASSVPAIIAGFAYGPVAGIAIGVVAAVGHGILFADFSGSIMTMIVIVAFVVPSSLIYRTKRTVLTEVIGLVVGCVCMVAAAIAGNLIITPAWLGMPMEAVIAMIVPVLIPFNALKAVLNAVLSGIIFRMIVVLFKQRTDEPHE